MTLFDPGPPEKKRKVVNPPSAGKIAADPQPVWQITVGYTRFFVRASDEAGARSAYRVMYQRTGAVADDEIALKRLYHADIAALIEVDPKLARRLGKL